MNVGEICSGVVVLIAADASIEAAARRMREQHVGALVMVEAETARPIPTGIITDRDIVVSVVAEDLKRAASLKVRDIAVLDLYAVTEEESVWDVLQQMRDRGVRRVPVIDDEGTITGILSFSDILAVLTEELSDLVKLSARERMKERQVRRS